ncbi:MAG: prolyl oligopeptidase family serine peptidase [Henriciella sp.]|uniref:alpha/beta hydrolase family protein n=1 Tax=Henriciella sp. TaxID=1968823 RepID=UPI0032EB10A4
MVSMRVAALCATLLVTGHHAVAENADLYGRADGLAKPSLSPSGDRVAVECAPKGAPSVCIFDIATGGESIFIPLGGEYRLQDVYWPNEDYVLINVSEFESLQTVNGQKEYESQRVISYDLERRSGAILMRRGGNLLNTQNVISVLPDDGKHVVIEALEDSPGSNGWTLATHKVNLRSGKSRTQKVFGPSTVNAWYDLDGKPVADLVARFSSDTLELRHDGKTLLEYSSKGVQDFYIYGLDQAKQKLVVFRDIGEQDGLYYLSLDDGTMEPIMLGGFDVGRASAIRDTYTNSVVGFRYFDGFSRQLFIDETLGTAHAQLSDALAGKRVNLLSWNADKSKIAISAETPGRPADFYVLDRNSGQLGALGSLASHLASVPTGNVSAHTYTASDGLEMEAIVTLPPGKTMADGPFPTIVMPHGGPESRDGLGYDWWTQAYAAEGYMVLQPNFRGSSGYGQAFRNAGFGEFGGRMIGDIADAGAWAIGEGLVAENVYCAVGASYGGYAALMMGLDHGEQTRCIVSVNGVTEPFALLGRYNSGAEAEDYWERYLGADRYSDEGVRNRIAPRARASEFSQPLMLLYGQEDLVVPSDQTLSLASLMNGRPGFRLVSLGREDHDLRTSQVRNTVLAETLAFLKENHPAHAAPGG